jgi:hypothetical protein
MNPSTDDILRAINRTPASTVFVFPNNKNIIMAAEQCVPLTEKHVIFMPTKTVPQGISALLNFSPDESEESLVGAMGEAIGRSSLAMAAFTDPALALAFVKALEQREEYREILDNLEQKTKRVRQRQDEAKAHQRNVRVGKVRRAPVTKKD